MFGCHFLHFLSVALDSLCLLSNTDFRSMWWWFINEESESRVYVVNFSSKLEKESGSGRNDRVQ